MSDTTARVLDAAAALVSERGWAGLSMGTVAKEAGVSRQTVYTLVGSRGGLAEALVGREVRSFLDVVDEELGRGADVVEAVRRTVHRVLVLAAGNPLLVATVSASHGTTADEVLPLLTTRSEHLLGSARAVVDGHLALRVPAMPEPERAVLVDTLVRVVMSHVVRPHGDPADASAGVAWVVSRLLPA